MLGEMRRVLRPGGVSMLIEVGGVGVEHFIPISEGMAEFFAWLEKEQGYSFRWLRMDQHYDSIEQAETLINFFFGGEMPEDQKGKKDIPEVAGIWWRREG
jgi:ubiquinone/menaquinone biosynthesis C-methylase UbiE